MQAQQQRPVVIDSKTQAQANKDALLDTIAELKCILKEAISTLS